MNRGFLRCTIFLAVLIVFVCCSGACADFSSEMHVTEWTWEESKSAVFEGSVFFNGYDHDKMVMKLSFTATPEATDSGRIVFQTINGKKLTLRKESDTYVFTPGDQTEFHFIGNWRTPESVFFDKVVVTLRVYSEDEATLLSEHRMEGRRENDEQYDPDDGKIRITADLPGITRIIGIASAAIWTAAIARAFWNRKKKR